MHVAFEIIAAAEPSGRWDRVVEILPWCAQAAAEEPEVTCGALRAGPAFAATVLARRGDVGHALELVPMDDDHPELGTFVAVAHWANYASLTMSGENARLSVRNALPKAQSGFLELGVVPMLEALVRLEMFEELAEFIPTARAQREAVVTIEPAVDRAVGLLALHGGDGTGAEELLRRALMRFEALEAPYEIARSQEALANVVSGAERDELLSSALSGYLALEAAPDAERVVVALRDGIASA